jgi:hypothetical protein
MRQEVGKKRIEVTGFPTSTSDAISLRQADPLTFGVWGAGMLGTVPNYQDQEHGIVIGSGSLHRGSRPVPVMSLIPIREDYAVDHPALDWSDQAAGTLGFVLRAEAPVQSLVDRLTSSLHLRSVREVALEELVHPTALSAGYAESVWT